MDQGFLRLLDFRGKWQDYLKWFESIFHYNLVLRASWFKYFKLCRACWIWLIQLNHILWNSVNTLFSLTPKFQPTSSANPLQNLTHPPANPCYPRYLADSRTYYYQLIEQYYSFHLKIYFSQIYFSITCKLIFSQYNTRFLFIRKFLQENEPRKLPKT